MEQDEAREPVPSHDAFISYSRRDKEFARRLGDALRSYKPPRDLNVAQRHLDVFRDEEDFTGVEYHSSVARHLKSSARLLLLCSPSARGSEYVDDEIRRFAESHGADNIIPILVSGTPNNEAAPGEEDRMAFPDALCEALEMPLAIDYRGFDPKKEKVNTGRFSGPWYTVLANIYGTSRSLIEQREKKREARRRRITGGIAAVVLAALVVAMFFWLQSIEERKVAAAKGLSNQAKLVQNDLELSVLLAVESMKRVPSLEADLVLRPGIALLPRLVASISHDQAYEVSFSPDRKLVATMTAREVKVSELHTGRETARLAPLVPVVKAVFSPDGKYLATASGSMDPMNPGNYAAQLWELGAKPREISRMPYDEPVNGVAFSPDGKYLATIDGSNARIWEAVPGRELVTLPHEATVLKLAFSPDGKQLATGTNGGAARLWSVPAGRKVFETDQEGIVKHLAFSPDGKLWATEDTIRDAATGRELFRLPSDALELSPSWEYAAALGQGGSVTIFPVWEDGSGEKSAPMVHGGENTLVAFSPDGAHMATAGGGIVKVWMLGGGEETRLRHDLVTSVAFSPDGKYLATSSDDTVRWWELTSGREAALMPDDDELPLAELSADGKYLATGGRVWEVPSGKQVARIPSADGADDVALSPDGKYLAIAGDGEAFLAESLSGRRVAPLRGSGNVRAVIFAPGGKHLATAGLDNHARVWEVPSGKEVAHMPHSDGLEPIAFSPDGKRLATGTINTETVTIWDSITGKELVRMTSKGAPGALTFSPDGKRLAAAIFDYTGGGAQVWDSTTGEESTHVAGGTLMVSVAFSPDGKYLATGGLDVAARLWRLDRSEKEVSRMPHRGAITALAFTADGKHLVTASADQTARLWQAISGRELARMQHLEVVMAMAISPDERYLATASNDSMNRLWYLKPADLIAEACRRLTRNLTREEWRQYVGDEPYSPTCPDLPSGAPPKD